MPWLLRSSVKLVPLALTACLLDQAERPECLEPLRQEPYYTYLCMVDLSAVERGPQMFSGFRYAKMRQDPGLRIVDASVIPLAPHRNSRTAVYAAAGRAACLVGEQYENSV